MEFSLAGLLISVAVVAPNLLLIRYSPRPALPEVAIPALPAWLERVGQASCLVVPAIAAPGEPAWGWLVVAVVALLVYYALWARYLLGGRRAAALFAPLGFLPVPMAVLPVIVFLAAAAWLSSPWISAAAVLLAAGHIPASVLTARTMMVLPKWAGEDNG